MSGCVDGLTVFRIYSFTHQRLYEMRNAACEFYTAPDYLAESFLTAYCVWDPTAVAAREGSEVIQMDFPRL